MKGKILKVKSGYNPNSSSVGSQIPAFLIVGLGSGVMTIMITQLINFIDEWIQKRKNQLKSG
ncbi:MAG: hypothetical protein HQK76_00115 [Desulfobacterales bacterium]|nr:hypothetical protein [Desulfobacterales bacterium]